MGTEAAIGMGSNLGDRLAHLQTAWDALIKIDGVTPLARSAVYETDPVDVPSEFSDMSFLNAVALFDVTLDVQTWSRHVHAIEDEMQRIRTNVRNAPRTIDLDLLFFGDCIMNQPHLHLPHPQCTNRRFVCQPLAEIRPSWVPPGGTEPITEILRHLPDQPTVRRYANQWF